MREAQCEVSGAAGYWWVPALPVQRACRAGSTGHTKADTKQTAEKAVGAPMAQTVRLDDDFIADVKIHALAAHRSIPKQIEYWAKIGRMAEDNPELSFSFIKDAMLAAEQVAEGNVTPHVRITPRG